MAKYIKTVNDNYNYINTDFIVVIEYIAIEDRSSQYKDEPTSVILADGCYYKISNEDAEMLLKGE